MKPWLTWSFLLVLLLLVSCQTAEVTEPALSFTFEASRTTAVPRQPVTFTVRVKNTSQTEQSFYYAVYIDDSDVYWKRGGPFVLPPDGDFSDVFRLTPTEDTIGKTTFTVKIENDTLSEENQTITVSIEVLPTNMS